MGGTANSTVDGGYTDEVVGGNMGLCGVQDGCSHSSGSLTTAMKIKAGVANALMSARVPKVWGRYASLAFGNWCPLPKNANRLLHRKLRDNCRAR